MAASLTPPQNSQNSNYLSPARASSISFPGFSQSSPVSKRNSNSSNLSNQSSSCNSLASNGYISSGSFGSLGQSVAYGDTTGTKGFGTGNDYEGSRRSPSVPGAYGYSTGTKGFGTGNDFERRIQSARATPQTGNTPFGSHQSIPGIANGGRGTGNKIQQQATVDPAVGRSKKSESSNQRN